jgi:hypothetical protein
VSEPARSNRALDKPVHLRSDPGTAAARTLAPLAVLGLLMALSLAALLYVTRGETFYVTDEFHFAYYRHKWVLDALLTPYNGHLIALPNAVFNVLFDVGGFANYLPYRLGTMPLTLVSAGLLFMYARRRVGDWPAVAVGAVILFFGPAWQALLVPIGILSFVVPVAAGIAALLALDRGDRRGDALACGFLILGLLSQSVALIFLGAAAIELLLSGQRWRRWWVVAVPAALYVAWYALYSDKGGTGDPFGLEELQHLAAIPRFAFDGITTTFGTVTGPGTIANELGWSKGAQHALGGVIAVCAAALIAVRLAGSGAVRPRLWGLIAAFVAFWLFTALARANRAEAPEQSRYLYPSAVLLLLITAETLRGVRLMRVAAFVIAGAVGLSIVANLVALRHYGKDARNTSRLVSGELGVLELEKSWVASHEEWEFRTSPRLPTAGRYFKETAVYGESPALDPRRLPALSSGQRARVDTVLVRLLGLRLTPTRGALGRSPSQGPGRPGTGVESCAVLRAGSAATGVEFAARSAHVVIEATGSSPVQLRARRLADTFSTEVLGNVPAGSARLLRLPPDDLPTPWRLRLSGGPGTVCSV